MGKGTLTTSFIFGDSKKKESIRRKKTSKKRRVVFFFNLSFFMNNAYTNTRGKNIMASLLVRKAKTHKIKKITGYLISCFLIPLTKKKKDKVNRNISRLSEVATADINAKGGNMATKNEDRKPVFLLNTRLPI
jgi:hypothetical protein